MFFLWLTQKKAARKLFEGAKPNPIFTHECAHALKNVMAGRCMRGDCGEKNHGRAEIRDLNDSWEENRLCSVRFGS